MVDINTDDLYRAAFSIYYGWGEYNRDENHGKEILNNLYKSNFFPHDLRLMYCLGFALYEGVIEDEKGKEEGDAWLSRVKDECGHLDPLRYMAAAALRHIRRKDRSLSDAAILQKLEEMHKDQKQMQKTGENTNQAVHQVKETGEDTNKAVHQTQEMLAAFIHSIDAVNAELLAKIDALGKSEEAILAFLKNAQEEYDRIVQTELPRDVRDQHEAELEKLFGEDWRNEKRLCSMTCDRLVAARVLLHYSVESGLRDYRGVVISATSALEYELYRRFCEGYIAYLDASCLSDERKKEIKSVRFGQNFMMGSLMYYLQESDRIGGVDRLRPEDERKLLNGYLSKYVMSEAAFAIKETKNYTHLGHVYVGMRGEKDGIFSMKVKQIKENYRDKAAHKEIIDRVTASECCREIGIGTAETAVQNIEGVLKELLILTKPYVMPQ